ncbi:MAG: hypothetical protein WDW38_001233 [Sanguina aurantia]
MKLHGGLSGVIRTTLLLLSHESSPSLRDELLLHSLGVVGDFEAQGARRSGLPPLPPYLASCLLGVIDGSMDARTRHSAFLLLQRVAEEPLTLFRVREAPPPNPIDVRSPSGQTLRGSSRPAQSTGTTCQPAGSTGTAPTAVVRKIKLGRRSSHAAVSGMAVSGLAVSGMTGGGVSMGRSGATAGATPSHTQHGADSSAQPLALQDEAASRPTPLDPRPTQQPHLPVSPPRDPRLQQQQQQQQHAPEATPHPCTEPTPVTTSDAFRHRSDPVESEAGAVQAAVPTTNGSAQAMDADTDAAPIQHQQGPGVGSRGRCAGGLHDQGNVDSTAPPTTCAPSAAAAGAAAVAVAVAPPPASISPPAAAVEAPPGSEGMSLPSRPRPSSVSNVGNATTSPPAASAAAPDADAASSLLHTNATLGTHAQETVESPPEQQQPHRQQHGGLKVKIKAEMLLAAALASPNDSLVVPSSTSFMKPHPCPEMAHLDSESSAAAAGMPAAASGRLVAAPALPLPTPVASPVPGAPTVGSSGGAGPAADSGKLRIKGFKIKSKVSLGTPGSGFVAGTAALGSSLSPSAAAPAAIVAGHATAALPPSPPAAGAVPASAPQPVEGQGTAPLRREDAHASCPASPSQTPAPAVASLPDAVLVSLERRAPGATAAAQTGAGGAEWGCHGADISTHGAGGGAGGGGVKSGKGEKRQKEPKAGREDEDEATRDARRERKSAKKAKKHSEKDRKGAGPSPSPQQRHPSPHHQEARQQRHSRPSPARQQQCRSLHEQPNPHQPHQSRSPAHQPQHASITIRHATSSQESRQQRSRYHSESETLDSGTESGRDSRSQPRVWHRRDALQESSRSRQRERPREPAERRHSQQPPGQRLQQRRQERMSRSQHSQHGGDRDRDLPSSGNPMDTASPAPPRRVPPPQQPQQQQQQQQPSSPSAPEPTTQALDQPLQQQRQERLQQQLPSAAVTPPSQPGQRQQQQHATTSHPAQPTHLPDCCPALVGWPVNTPHPYLCVPHAQPQQPPPSTGCLNAPSVGGQLVLAVSDITAAGPTTSEPLPSYPAQTSSLMPAVTRTTSPSSLPPPYSYCAHPQQQQQQLSTHQHAQQQQQQQLLPHQHAQQQQQQQQQLQYPSLQQPRQAGQSVVTPHVSPAHPLLQSSQLPPGAMVGVRQPVATMLHPGLPLQEGLTWLYDATTHQAVAVDAVMAVELHRQGHSLTPLPQAHRSRLSHLQASVNGPLLSKREALLQLHARLATRTAEVCAARAALEREALALSGAMVERLRSAESLKVALLEREQREVLRDLDGIAVLVGQVATASQAPPVDFLNAYRTLADACGRLVDKPFQVGTGGGGGGPRTGGGRGCATPVVSIP